MSEHTPEPVIPEEKTIQHARGQLVTAVRDAERHRHEAFERLREEMNGLDVEWEQSLRAAWTRYDAELTRLGVSER